jgi:hypothetical protein
VSVAAAGVLVDVGVSVVPPGVVVGSGVLVAAAGVFVGVSDGPPGVSVAVGVSVACGGGVSVGVSVAVAVSVTASVEKFFPSCDANAPTAANEMSTAARPAPMSFWRMSTPDQFGLMSRDP